MYTHYKYEETPTIRQTLIYRQIQKQTGQETNGQAHAQSVIRCINKQKDILTGRQAH